MAIVPPGRVLSIVTSSSTSALISREFAQSADSSVVEKTTLSTLFTHSACARSAGVALGLSSIFDNTELPDWRRTLLFTLVGSVQHHPLAQRLLAGLEPEVTVRVLEIPALTELRKACAERLRSEQRAGSVRADIEPVAIANGIVAIMLSLLMSVVQLGPEAAGPYSADVAAVFEAIRT